MASYKIYFLKFCHKNQSSSFKKWPSELQNATRNGIFKENRFFAHDLLFLTPTEPWNNCGFSMPSLGGAFLRWVCLNALGVPFMEMKGGKGVKGVCKVTIKK